MLIWCVVGLLGFASGDVPCHYDAKLAATTFLHGGDLELALGTVKLWKEFIDYFIFFVDDMKSYQVADTILSKDSYVVISERFNISNKLSISLNATYHHFPTATHVWSAVNMLWRPITPSINKAALSSNLSVDYYSFELLSSSGDSRRAIGPIKQGTNLADIDNLKFLHLNWSVEDVSSSCADDSSINDCFTHISKLELERQILLDNRQAYFGKYLLRRLTKFTRLAV